LSTGAQFFVEKFALITATAPSRKQKSTRLHRQNLKLKASKEYQFMSNKNYTQTIQ